MLFFAGSKLLSSPVSSSSFKEFRGMRKRFLGGVLFALLVLAATEVFSRTQLVRLSKEFERCYRYPALAEQFAEQPGLHLIAVGNSLTERGIDPGAMERVLNGGSANQQGANSVHAAAFHAYSSGVCTWYYMINKYFWEAGRKPDFIVFNFVTNRLEREDKFLTQKGRAAQFFVSAQDRPEVLRTDLETFDQRAEFVVSSQWAAYGNRDLIANRLFAYIPGFWKYTTKVNEGLARQRVGAVGAAANAAAGDAGGAGDAPQQEPLRYEGLRRLLRKAQAEDCKLYFVAYPLPPQNPQAAYEVRPQTLQMIRDAGMEFIDMRHVPGLTPDCYMDFMHLNPKGASLYSARLAERLAPLLAKRMLAKRPRTLSSSLKAAGSTPPEQGRGN